MAHSPSIFYEGFIVMPKQFLSICIVLLTACFIGCGGVGSEPIPPSNPSAPPSTGIDADGDGVEDSPVAPALETAS